MSKEIARELTGLGARDVQVAPNCVDIRQHLPRKNSSAGSLRVLYLGWVTPEKGVRDLLIAAGRSNSWSLTVAGPLIEAAWGGEPPEAIVEKKGLGERVRFLGRQDPDQARSLFDHYDVLALPSYTEGFPNVVLEAMEAGIPVVATSVGAVPEVLRDGIDGFVVPVRDVGALASRLECLAADPELRRRIGASARDRVMEHYSVDRVVSMWVEMYRRVAAG